MASVNAAALHPMFGHAGVLADWTPKNQADYAQALDIAETLEGWAKRLRKGACARLAAGRRIPGWYLRPATATRGLRDAVAAWRASGWEAEAFIACCRPQLAELERRLAEGLGVADKSPEARRAFDGRFGALVETTQGDPRLARAAATARAESA